MKETRMVQIGILIAALLTALVNVFQYLETSPLAKEALKMVVPWIDPALLSLISKLGILALLYIGFRQVWAIRRDWEDMKSNFDEFLKKLESDFLKTMYERQCSIVDAVVEKVHIWLAGEVNDRFERIEKKLGLPEWPHTDKKI